MSHEYSKTPEALSRLTDSQFRVTQEDGTEPAFRNEYRSLFETTDTTSTEERTS
ncbi:hypothetical protein [Planotetraspora kaengkrachanensis]|uniref:Uncharacterized protein n=1 Tax=Planotetraspora kaengkrachanensis TaxID=575193 RepID=A0A8J3Q0A9_9ACTN|nr:hypothetical protein [Planotetraspora kaengkrachanensis]GIG84262.1 hypothetical protein Pka01_73890 [Planotetraspora kaengkrachanensis]